MKYKQFEADIFSTDAESRTISNIVSYIEEDDLLIDAYSFKTTVSRIEKTTLYAGNYYRSTTGDNGNPYFWKFGSTLEGGTAFSGVAFAFTYAGVTYSDSSIIFYDVAYNMPDIDWDSYIINQFVI